jgi:hypothetical protein
VGVLGGGESGACQYSLTHCPHDLSLARHTHGRNQRGGHSALQQHSMRSWCWKL